MVRVLIITKPGAGRGKGSMKRSSLGVPAGGGDAVDEGFSTGLGWIVCAGATRDVTDGLVNCAEQGAVSADECLDCHFLATIADERSPLFSCTTAE